MKTLALTVLMMVGTQSFAESCFIADHPETRVSDRSIPNQKKLWNACIDKRLAILEQKNPNYSEADGQEVGDDCLSAKITCESI